MSFRLADFGNQLWVSALLTATIYGITSAQQESAVRNGPVGAPSETGKHIYATRCASCHGTNAAGGEFGPSIVNRIALRSDEELVTLLHAGLTSGMPAFPDIVGSDLLNLVSFLRTLRPGSGLAMVHTRIALENGHSLEGVALNQGAADMQLLGKDHALYLLRKDAAGRYRVVTSQTDWRNYDGPDGDGRSGGSRFSTLTQITNANVADLQPKWLYTISTTGRLQSTPVVADGVMYVTAANECHALDAGNGRLIWHYRRPRTKGITGIAASGVNRGAVVAGGRVFMDTDNAHTIALNAMTGALLWDAEMVDWRENYNATSAPLLVGDMVITGVAGGDDGARGFIVALDQATGKERWRFWSVPTRGEKGSETWQGPGIDHPGGATWMTGAYDKELDTIYWPIGNPGYDLIGDERPGDNLYTDSVVALNPKDGTLKWYFGAAPFPWTVFGLSSVISSSAFMSSYPAVPSAAARRQKVCDDASDLSWARS